MSAPKNDPDNPKPSNSELSNITDSPVRVLLIDDQLIIGEAVRRMLATELDISFHCCTNPALAMSIIRELQPTVIFLDLIMPEIDGLILAKFLRANETTQEIPLVMLSSKEDPQLKAEAFNVGANDYLVKLPDKLELIARTRYHSKAYNNLQDLKKATTQAQLQTKKLETALQELQKAQSQMIQNEKMSSLGQLVAGIAHEINNPVNFIHGNLMYLEQYVVDVLSMISLYQKRHPSDDPEIKALAKEIDLEFLTGDLPKILLSMKNGTDRIRDIVLSLRNFSRMDESEFKRVDIHDGLESTLLILQHRLHASSGRPEIKILREYGKLPLVECSAGELNQVFMNILVNAIDAIESSYTLPKNTFPKNTFLKNTLENPSPESGDFHLFDSPKRSKKITIRTSLVDDNWIQILIIDNGMGIPEDIRQYIFNPFFTTKVIGKGTGMGLSISYQIITDKHNGRLECISTLHEGTKFIIEIPIRREILIG